MTVAQQPVSSKFEVQLNTGTTDLEQSSSERLALSTDGIFKTIQGEGPRLGRLTTFMRLAGCNLTCSWCDTSYTWDWQGKNGRVWSPKDEVKLVSLVDAAFLVKEQNTSSLTITGGEPLLQHRNLDAFFHHFDDNSLKEINFETNGTKAPVWSAKALRAAQKFNYVVSPKLKNSGNPILRNSLSALVKLYRDAPRFGEVDLKFVCESSKDFDEIEELLTYLSFEGATIAPEHIWIMPQGVEPGLLNCKAQEMAQEVLVRGWNLTTRFHLQLWSNARAR